MRLAALQRDFRNRLTSGTPQREGLGVYHNAYRVRLGDSLKETFERVFLWLGEDAFLRAARVHIENHPPRSWTLADYGADFPSTLAALYPDDPEVAELAWLDWALARAFDGPDAEIVAIPEGIDWEKAKLRPAPTLQLARIGTNAGAIWSALSAGEIPPAAARLPGNAALLVWRQGLVPCFRTIEMEEEAAIAMVRRGQSFGALCVMLVNRQGDKDGVARAGAYLAQWLADGLVIEVRQETGIPNTDLP